MEKVSVIIPVYNAAEYLEACLESVIKQTYCHMEILCINDCSTDGSAQILREYVQKDSRIRIFDNEENSGQAYARNVGIRQAAGEYILFVDADDVVCPDLVESCMKAGLGCDMVCFDYSQTKGMKTYPRQFAYRMAEGRYDGGTFFAESVRRHSIIFAPWSRMYSRRFLAENHISFYSGIIYEDVLFSFYCYIFAKNVYSLDRKLYEYRIRGNSTMTKDITGKNIESSVVCICELTRFYLKSGFNREISQAVEGYIRKVCREYISIYRRWGDRNLEPALLGDKKEYWKIYRTFSELLVRPGKILDFSQSLVERMRQFPYVVLYGAGEIARSTIGILDQYDIPLYGIAVSSMDGNRKSLLGNPVRELHEYGAIRRDCLVLIGTVPEYYQEIKQQLEKFGFIHWMEVIETYGA